MGFLDNLESALNIAESREDRAAQGSSESKRREASRADVLAAGANAHKLKTSRYTNELLSVMTRLGYTRRIKVRVAWIGSNLRFEARDRRLELRPTAQGIVAVFGVGAAELHQQSVELNSRPEKLAKEWMATVPDPEPAPSESLPEV
jgi:hypothetical protein